MRSASRSLPFFLLFVICISRPVLGDGLDSTYPFCQEVATSGDLETEHTLETLMLRAQAGDQTAFAELWGRLEYIVRGQCRRLMHTADDAEDLYQDVALIAWRKKHQCRSSVGGWVRMIARRTWINKAIRQQRSVSLNRIARKEDDPLVGLIHGRELSPDDLAVFQEMQRTVRDAVEELSDSSGVRTAAKLFYFEGLSLIEIAEATNRPVGTVKRQLFTARLRLRDTVASMHGPKGG